MHLFSSAPQLRRLPLSVEPLEAPPRPQQRYRTGQTAAPRHARPSSLPQPAYQPPEPPGDAANMHHTAHGRQQSRAQRGIQQVTAVASAAASSHQVCSCKYGISPGSEGRGYCLQWERKAHHLSVRWCIAYVDAPEDIDRYSQHKTTTGIIHMPRGGRGMSPNA